MTNRSVTYGIVCIAPGASTEPTCGKVHNDVRESWLCQLRHDIEAWSEKNYQCWSSRLGGIVDDGVERKVFFEGDSALNDYLSRLHKDYFEANGLHTCGDCYGSSVFQEAIAAFLARDIAENPRGIVSFWSDGSATKPVAVPPLQNPAPEHPTRRPARKVQRRAA